MRSMLVLLAALGLLPSACSGGGSTDTRNGRPPDLRTDGPADAGQERPGDAPHDAGGESAPDASRLADALEGDATPTLATVLYTTTPDPSLLGLRTVSTAAPGQPTPVVSWSGYLDLVPLGLTGLQEAVPVSPLRPQVMSEQPASFQGIRLPAGLGRLYHVRRKLIGTSGLLQVRKDGSLDLIREVPGVYADTIGSHVALAADGSLGAAVAGPAGVFLFHTDGTPFPGGSALWKDISPPGGGIAQVKPRSLTLAGGWLFAVGTDSAGKDVLLRAPVDGSAPLAVVTLPTSGGQPPVSLSDGLAVSADGKWLALAAGSSSTQRDLHVIEASSAAAKNLTKAPGILADRGDSFGGDGARLALSPAGSLVAYLSGPQGSEELLVARTDGSSPPKPVSSDTRFKPEVVHFSNLHFPDEANLLFTAGVSATQQDIYRWDEAGNKISALTGGKSPPFEGKGLFAPRAGWRSPSGQWLYLVLQHFLDDSVDLFGIDTKSFGLLKVTTGAEVQTAPGSFAACPSSGTVFFAARPKAKLYPNEIWSFDQDAPKPAAQRTAVSGPGRWFVYGLLLSPDCSRLVWSGGGSLDRRELWLLPAQGGPVRKLTSAPTFIGASTAFSPDQETLIYASGGTSASSTLKAVPVAPGPPVTLDNSAGTVHVFAVY